MLILNGCCIRNKPSRDDYCKKPDDALTLTKTDPFVLRKIDPPTAHSHVNIFRLLIEKLVVSLRALSARSQGVWSAYC
jgi:hypothetical protein